MRNTVAAVVVALAVFGGAVLPATATVGTLSLGGGDEVGLVGGTAEEAVPSAATAGDVAQGDDGNVSPGERLSGVVGVQGAELGSEVAERRLAAALNASATDRERANVVASEVERTRDRLDALRDRQAALREALQNGSIGPGEFRARMAVLAANVSSTQRILNASAAAAADLPSETLEEAGVNVTAIETLRENASELSGPEVTEIARSIGGPDTGKQIGQDDRGPPAGTPGNGSGPPDDAGDQGPPGNESAANNESATGGESEGEGEKPDDTPGNDESGEGNDNGERGDGESEGEGEKPDDTPGNDDGSGEGNDNGEGSEGDGEGEGEKPDDTPGNDDGSGEGNDNGEGGGY